MLAFAIQYATARHAYQRDKAGQPYIFHPLRVMLRIAEQFPGDEGMLIAALLHDVVEDCNVTVNDIAVNFGQEVATIVDAVSRRPDEIYRDAILRAKMHPKGRHVKIADIRDNVDRLHTVPLDQAGDLAKRYKMALDLLIKDEFFGEEIALTPLVRCTRHGRLVCEECGIGVEE